jgi:PAS domain S-box-containing protein
MNLPSEPRDEREQLRERIIGMGETSVHKSYYPLLQQRLAELERFRALIDETNDMILMVRTPGNRCVDINHACNVQLGYSTDDLKNMDILTLFTPEKRGQIRDVFTRAAATRTQEKVETVLCTSQGQTIPAELLIRFVTFDNDNYGVIVARNISERLRYERELVAIEKLQGTTGDIQSHIEFAENYQKLGVQTPIWQNFSEILLYAISHLPPIPLTRTSGIEQLEILSDPLLEKGLTHLMEFLYTHGGISEPVRVTYEETGSGLCILLRKTAPGIPQNQKVSVFMWAPAKTSGPNLFFIREILDMTGIVIDETGDSDTLCFVIRVPKSGYRCI